MFLILTKFKYDPQTSFYPSTLLWSSKNCVVVWWEIWEVSVTHLAVDDCTYITHMFEQPGLGAQSTERQYAFAVALAVYSTFKQLSKARATTVKWQEKSIKTKELLFPLNKTNYIDFLESMLEKHGKAQYKVSSKQWYSFKYIILKTKRFDFSYSQSPNLTKFYLASVSHVRQWT